MFENENGYLDGSPDCRRGSRDPEHARVKITAELSVEIKPKYARLNIVNALFIRQFSYLQLKFINARITIIIACSL